MQMLVNGPTKEWKRWAQLKVREKKKGLSVPEAEELETLEQLSIDRPLYTHEQED